MDITSSQLVTPQCLLSQGLYNQLLVCFSWHGALLEFFRESFCPVTLWEVWSKLKEDRYKYFSGVPTELKKTRDDFGVIIFGKVSWGFMSKSWQLHDVQLWVVWAFCFCFFFFLWSFHSTSLRIGLLQIKFYEKCSDTLLHFSCILSLNDSGETTQLCKLDPGL